MSVSSFVFPIVLCIILCMRLIIHICRFLGTSLRSLKSSENPTKSFLKQLSFHLFISLGPIIFSLQLHLHCGKISFFILPKTHEAVCHPVWLSLCVSVSLVSIYVNANLSMCPFPYLSVCPSVYLSVCPSVHLSLSITSASLFHLSPANPTASRSVILIQNASQTFLATVISRGFQKQMLSNI